MKKVLLLLIIVCSGFLYSNTRCELKAKKEVETFLALTGQDGIKAEYLGQNKGKPPYYLYDVTGAESKVLLAIDMETGSIYAAENYSRNDLSSGKVVDFELLITDVESLKCE